MSFLSEHCVGVRYMGKGKPLGVLLLVAGCYFAMRVAAWLPVCSLFVPGWAHAVYNPLECYNFFTGSSMVHDHLSEWF